MMANFAHSAGSPFFFLDVPQGEDEAAVAYLTAQLQELVERLTAALNIPFDPERMRHAERTGAGMIAIAFSDLSQNQGLLTRYAGLLPCGRQLACNAMPIVGAPRAYAFRLKAHRGTALPMLWFIWLGIRLMSLEEGS